MLENLRKMIQGPQLPVRPQGRMSRDQQAQYSRSFNEAKRKRNKFLVSRRRVVTGIAGVAAVGTTAVVFGPKVVESLLPYEEPPEFDGSVEQTKLLLERWNWEVGSNKDRLVDYAPKITKLASAYFSTQMQEIYPDKKTKYAQRLDNRIRIASSEEIEKEEPCEKEDSGVPGYVDPNTDKIIFRQIDLKVINLINLRILQKHFFL